MNESAETVNVIARRNADRPTEIEVWDVGTLGYSEEEEEVKYDPTRKYYETPKLISRIANRAGSWRRAEHLRAAAETPEHVAAIKK